MKVCFVGFGSMGKRHLRNFTFLMQQKNEVYVIDLFRNHDLFWKQKKTFGELRSQDECKAVTGMNNVDEIESEYKEKIHKTYYNMEELPRDYDILFITNPTIFHYETLRLLQNHAKHFFIEKPVFDHVRYNINGLRLHTDGVYYVACPLRYHPVIQYLKKQINFQEVYSLRAISSSYLPEWRVGTDYRKSYSANKNLGGGVAIDLIHEWDYISYLLGIPQKVISILDKVSDLEIDTEDIAIYIGKATNTLVELHLDYFGRESVRTIELFMKKDTVVADIINATITFKKEKKSIHFAKERDDWQKAELSAFLDMIDGKKENDNSIENAVAVLRLAQKYQKQKER